MTARPRAAHRTYTLTYTHSRAPLGSLTLQFVDDANLTNIKAQFLLKDQYGAALAGLTFGNKVASVAALYSVQAFLEGILFPKGEFVRVCVRGWVGGWVWGGGGSPRPPPPRPGGGGAAAGDPPPSTHAPRGGTHVTPRAVVSLCCRSPLSALIPPPPLPLSLPPVRATGLLDGLFMKLYEEDIVEEEAFWAWKDDSTHSDIPGKQRALVNSVRFFNWLQESAAADEEDEEDSEVEEALRDVVRPNNSTKLR